MIIKTCNYSFKPIEFITALLYIWLCRYRYVLMAFVSAVFAGAFVSTNFAYAAVIIVFGTFPFLLLHLYMSTLNFAGGPGVFAEKYIIADTDKSEFSVVLKTGEVYNYNTTDIKYETLCLSNYIFSLKSGAFLNIPIKSFGSRDDERSFNKFFVNKK